MYHDEECIGPGADFYGLPGGEAGIAEAREGPAATASATLSPDRAPERCRVCGKALDRSNGRKASDFCPGLDPQTTRALLRELEALKRAGPPEHAVDRIRRQDIENLLRFRQSACKRFQNFWDAWQRAFYEIDWTEVPPERRAIVRGELVRAANHVPVAVQHTARDKRGRFVKA